MSGPSSSLDGMSARELSTLLTVQLAELAGQEFALAKAELRATARRGGSGMMLGLGAGLLGLTGWLTLVAAAIAGISVALPVWAAALIIGVPLALAAGVLAMLASRRLSSMSQPLPLTAESVLRDVREIREKARR